MFSLYSITEKCLKSPFKFHLGDSSFKENEHMRVKMDLLENFFQAVLLVLTAVLIPYTIQYFQRDVSPQKYIIFGLFALTLLIILTHKTLKRHLNLIILGYLLLMISLLATVYRSMLPEVNAREGFYMGYAFAMIHRLVGYHALRTRYMIILYIVSIAVKFPLIPDSDTISNVIVILLDISTIFLCLMIERAERKLFKATDKIKMESETHKKLLNSLASEELVVLSRDFNVYYMNESFKASLGSETIKESLNRYKIDEESIKMQESLFLEIGFIQQDQDQILSLSDLVFCFGKEYNAFKNFEAITLEVSKSGEENDEDSKMYKVKVFPFEWNNAVSLGIGIQEIKTIRKDSPNAWQNIVIPRFAFELRPPLNGILYLIEHVKTKIDQPEALEHLDLCWNIANMTLLRMNNLLDLELIMKNSLRIYPAKVSIEKIVNEVHSLYKHHCTKKEIDLKIDIDPQVPKKFKTDEARLAHVMRNLVENATKFTLKGGITIKVRPENPEKSKIRFIIEDTGIGMREQDIGLIRRYLKQKNLFETRSRGLSVQGIGIGLHVSNTIIRLLNPANKEVSQLQFETSHGKGSSFSFTIESLERNEESSEFSEANISQGSLRENEDVDLAGKMSTYCGQVGQRKIEENLLEPQEPLCLVVDDNAFNIIVATHCMEEFGYKVKSCLKGQEAIEEMQAPKVNGQQPFRLILMDGQMPEMDGFDVTRRLRAMMEEGVVDECPIIGLTFGECDKNMFEEAGAFETIEKPVDKSKLGALIKKLQNIQNC